MGIYMNENVIRLADNQSQVTVCQQGRGNTTNILLHIGGGAGGFIVINLYSTD